MCELINKARPIVDVSQEIRNFDQRIHLADFDVQFLDCRGNVAGGRRDDQRSAFKADPLQLSGSCPIGKAFQIEVEHVPCFA